MKTKAALVVKLHLRQDMADMDLKYSSAGKEFLLET